MAGRSLRARAKRGLAVAGITVALLAAVAGIAYTQRLGLAEQLLRLSHPEAFHAVRPGLAPAARLQEARLALACAGHTEQLQLLDALDLAEDNRQTALHCAARNGHADTALYLLQRGARIDAIRPRQSHEPPHAPQTALQEAVHQRNRQLVEVLLRAGADPNVVTNAGTALHFAAQAQDAALLRQLFAAGARLDAMAHEPALFSWAQASRARGGAWRDSLAAAEAAGLSLQARDPQGRSLLHWAAAAGDLVLAQLLVELGLPPLEADAQGALPFMHLVGHIEEVRREGSPELRAALLLLMEGVQELDATVRVGAAPASAADGNEAAQAGHWRQFPERWTSYTAAEAVPWLRTLLAEAASGATPSSRR